MHFKWFGGFRLDFIYCNILNINVIEFIDRFSKYSPFCDWNRISKLWHRVVWMWFQTKNLVCINIMTEFRFSNLLRRLDCRFNKELSPIFSRCFRKDLVRFCNDCYQSSFEEAIRLFWFISALVYVTFG